MPVLRHRQEERAALATVSTSAKMLPLIELVKALPRSDSQGGFAAAYTKSLTELERPVMLDFPMYLKLDARSEPDVGNFLRPLQQDPTLRRGLFKQLARVPGLIPVVTYNPQLPFVPLTVHSEAVALRELFPGRMAFRLYVSGFAAAMKEVAQVATVQDIVLLDLDDLDHLLPSCQMFYTEVAALKTTVGCTTVIVRAPLNHTITNAGLVDNQPVRGVHNSLLKDYSGLGFDAFGDFVGIKKDMLHKGFPYVSPGYIFFGWPNNEYIGFRWKNRALRDFVIHIAPTALASKYFAQFSATHRQTCPGCLSVTRIAGGREKGQQAAKWKRIAMMHYLFTMEEVL